MLRIILVSTALLFITPIGLAQANSDFCENLNQSCLCQFSGAQGQCLMDQEKSGLYCHCDSKYNSTPPTDSGYQPPCDHAIIGRPCGSATTFSGSPWREKETEE